MDLLPRDNEDTKEELAFGDRGERSDWTLAAAAHGSQESSFGADALHGLRIVQGITGALGRVDGLIAEARRRALENPDQAGLQETLAVLYLLDRQYTKAAETATLVNERFGNSAEAKLIAAGVLAESSNHEAARAIYQAVWQSGSLPQLRILLERLKVNGETNGFRPTLRIPSILAEPTEWDG